jgi:hypothetical protein
LLQRSAIVIGSKCHQGDQGYNQLEMKEARPPGLLLPRKMLDAWNTSTRHVSAPSTKPVTFGCAI